MTGKKVALLQKQGREEEGLVWDGRWGYLQTVEIKGLTGCQRRYVHLGLGILG